MAEDANSVFRAVSDALFGTQVYQGLIRQACVWSSMRRRAPPTAVGAAHSVVQELANMFNVRIDIVQYESDSLISCTINNKKRAAGKSREVTNTWPL